MNNMAVILHVNNRPFYVFYYDVKRGKCLATSSTFLAIVTSSYSDISYSMMLLYSGENYIMMDATLSINHTGQTEKYAWPQRDSNLRPLECEPNALPTELHGQDYHIY